MKLCQNYDFINNYIDDDDDDDDEQFVRLIRQLLDWL